MNPKYSLIVSFLLHLKGLFAQPDTARVHTESHCVPTGSSFTIWGSCEYPDGHTFQSMLWKHRSNNGETVADPSKDSRYKYRKNHYNCYLTITGVKESDTGSFYMSFTYSNVIVTYSSTDPSGLSVHVTDLQVTVDSERVTEGQNVTLTCKSSCPLTSRKHSFIWWKNEARLDRFGDALRVSAVSREDSGRYSCAMEGYEAFRSNETLLTVNPPDVTVMERAGKLTLCALLTLIALLLICATLWMMMKMMMKRKKRQSLTKPEGKEQNKQNDTRDSTVTFDLEEKVKPVHPEEVQYSHVHFIRFPNTQTCGEEAEVLYSEITVLPSSDRRSNCRK